MSKTKMVHFLNRSEEQLMDEMMQMLREHKSDNVDSECKMVIGKTNRPFQRRYEYWIDNDHVCTIHYEARDKSTGSDIVTWLEWNDKNPHGYIEEFYSMNGLIPEHIIDMYDEDEDKADEMEVEFFETSPEPNFES
jgi:hypothetical protein